MTARELREERANWAIESCPLCKRSDFYLKRNVKTRQMLMICQGCECSVVLEVSSP